MILSLIVSLSVLKGLVGFLLLGFVCVGSRLHCCGLVLGEEICGFWRMKMVVFGWSVVYVFVGFLVNTNNGGSSGCVTFKDQEPEGDDRPREMKQNQ